MSSPESKLWQWFNKNIGKTFDYCERTETKRADGFPDVIFCENQKVFPIELKVVPNEPKRVPLRRDQVQWWQKWMNSGGCNGAILMQFNEQYLAIIDPNHVADCALTDNQWEHHSIIYRMEQLSKISRQIMNKCYNGWD